MHKFLYSCLTRIPIFGSLYKAYTRPMFCSMGMADGEYDYALKLMKAYQEAHPKEQITRQLIERLVKESLKK